MLKSILDYFNTHLVPVSGGNEGDLETQTRLAVAVLLIEIAESDFEKAAEEKAAILEAIEQQFQLDPSESKRLMQLAEQEHAQSTDYFQFTSLINKSYSQEKKVKIIEALWQVAYADQHLHHYEEHVIRRLADLIYVSHSDFLAAKHRVMAERG
ncbi:MAG: TerB family tellurite resistance protein [Candidatus Thiodiazotropha sp. 6PLUC2]